MIDVETYPTIYDSIDRASRKSKPQSDRLLGKMEAIAGRRDSRQITARAEVSCPERGEPPWR